MLCHQLAHTPMQSLATEEKFKNELVLVAGREAAADVALNYGFNNIVTMDEYHEHWPEVFYIPSPQSLPLLPFSQFSYFILLLLFLKVVA